MTIGMLAFLAFAGLLPGPDASGTVPVLEVGKPITSTITAADSVVTTARIDADHKDAPVRGRTLLVRVPEPGPYTIDLKSHFFDAYLVVRDRSGTVLAEDDDGLVGTHARIAIERASPSDDLTVEACALHGGTGDFVVSLSPGRPPSPSELELRTLILEDARERLSAVEAARGPEAVETADCLHSLALLLRSRGDLGAAQPLFERALAIREKRLGSEHLTTVESRHTLALTLMHQGRLAEARPLFESVLAIRERVLGPEHRNTGVSVGQIGELLRQEGKYGEAVKYFERSAAIMESARGPDHPDTATSLHNWAGCLMRLGKFAPALRLIERAREILEQSYGPEHGDLAQMLGSQALARQYLGDYAAARADYERALAMSEKCLGPDHATTAVLVSNLASVLDHQGEYEAARPMLERVLALREKVLGRDHPGTATNLFNLAALLEAQGNFDAAEPLYERVVAIRERTYGPDHPETATAVNNLAHLHYSRENYGEARPLLERALSAFEKSLGPEHSDTAVCLDGLGVLLRLQGEFAAARPILERAAAIKERAFGPDHPRTALGLSNVADCLSDLGSFDAARRQYERALSVLDSVIGPSHVETTRVRLNYIRALLNGGERERAWSVTESALAACEEAARRRFAGLSEQERFAFLAVLRPILDLHLTIAREFPAREPAAYESVLRWKGIVTRSLATSRRTLEAQATPEVLAAIVDLRATQARLSRLASAAGRKDGDAGGLDLVELGETRGRLEREILGRLGTSPDDRPATTSDLADALMPGMILVDFFVHRVYEPAEWKEGVPGSDGKWTKDQVAAWVVRAGEAKPHRIDLGPAARMEDEVRSFLEEMQSDMAAARGIAATVPSGGRKGHANDRLRAALYDPLRRFVESASLVVVSPDGFLGTVPLGTLRDEDGTFLIERTSFVTLQDAASLGTIGRTERRSQVPSLLIAGGIDYGERERPGERSSAPGRGMGGVAEALPHAWERLPFTASEARSIASLHEREFGPEKRAGRLLLENADAGEGRIKLELPRHTHLHLATHGYFEPEGVPSMWRAARESAEKRSGRGLRGPGDEGRRVAGFWPGLLSGLVLAGANRLDEKGGEDGLLTAEEVSWLTCRGAISSSCRRAIRGSGWPRAEKGCSGSGALSVRRERGR